MRTCNVPKRPMALAGQPQRVSSAARSGSIAANSQQVLLKQPQVDAMPKILCRVAGPKAVLLDQEE